MNNLETTAAAASPATTTVSGSDGPEDAKPREVEPSRTRHPARSPAAGHVDAKDKTAVAAYERLFRQSAKLADAQAKVRRERDRLDEMTAEAVSKEPTSITWYAHPGALTIDQAVGAIGGGYPGIHHALQRYRKAHPAKSPTRSQRS